MFKVNITKTVASTSSHHCAVLEVVNFATLYKFSVCMKTYPETTPQALKTSDAFLAAVEGLTVTFWEMILCTYFVKKDVLLQKPK